MPDHHLITTAFDLPGHRIDQSFGIARGIVVRSRSIIGSFGAAIQTVFGGNISLYASLCERARQDAYDKMIAQAAGFGANAIIGMRYDATEIGSGITEVLCYGTAVRATPIAG
ncbi:YbjQ family protein [Burkholderia sp. 22PA0099]|uniref:YbjQ family protein n=1 Tax=Burkholderia sp. 22PA0099 TaxID=3237372 RepID=UPI0039C40AED